MTDIEHLLPRQQQRAERWLIYFFVALLYGLLFGLGGVLGIVYSQVKAKLPRPWRWSTFALSMSWGIFVWAVGWYDPLARYWLLISIPLLGLTAGIWETLLWLYEHLLRPITWNETLRKQEHWLQQRLEQRIARYVREQPQRADLLAWGLFVAGDKKAQQDNIQRHANYLWFEETLLDQHLLLIGAPGSGKTEALKHLISEILSKTERDVFIVDGKGESQFSHDVQALFQEKRGVDIPVFRMGTREAGRPYNGFVGDAEAIQQRLVAMFQIEQQSGDAEFYANVNRALLNLVCRSSAGPPRNLNDLDKYLSLGWLRYAYRHDKNKQKALERYAQWFTGFRVRADALIWDFADYLAPNGFSLDNNTGAIFSLRTAAMGDTTRRFFNFLIEDFKDWVGKRQTRPAVLIVDEFGQLNSPEIIALIELARSAQLSIILATQDLSTVKSMQVRDRLLSSIQTKILMKTDTPELVGDMAGTRKAAHLTYQTDEIDMTGRGSIRVEDERKVDLNAVRQFPPGRAYLIRSGVSIVVQFHQI